MTKIVSRVLNGALAAAMAAVGSGALVAATAQPASAAGWTSKCVASSCDLYAFAGSGEYGIVPQGTPLQMVCWTDAGWVDGSNRWFKVNSIYDSGSYMPANQVGSQATVGHC